MKQKSVIVLIVFVLGLAVPGYLAADSNEDLQVIKKAVKKEIPVVVTSQTIYGRVNPRVYTSLRILFQEGEKLCRVLLFLIYMEDFLLLRLSEACALIALHRCKPRLLSDLFQNLKLQFVL